MSRRLLNLTLADLADGQEADLFLLLATKEELKTRTGTPYFRVTFRDATRDVSFPIWDDSAWASSCREQWQAGKFYKVRAIFRGSQYGPQLELRKIREVEERDREDGFDEAAFQPKAAREAPQVFAQLVELVKAEIGEPELRGLVLHLLESNAAAITVYPAATRNHHAYVGGFVEHILGVVRNCVFLADKYRQQYPDLSPPLSRDLVIAGGVLHDIGKLRELEPFQESAVYTPAGELIGHVLQGRDMVREAAIGRAIDPETLLKLEHIIVAHQRLPEWGAPKPPMIPEALLVHYADDIDAKMQTFYAILRDETGEAHTTGSKNPLQQKVYRGTKS